MAFNGRSSDAYPGDQFDAHCNPDCSGDHNGLLKLAIGFTVSSLDDGPLIACVTAHQCPIER